MVEDPLYHMDFDLSTLNKPEGYSVVTSAGNFSINVCGKLDNSAALQSECAGENVAACLRSGDKWINIGMM